MQRVAELSPESQRLAGPDPRTHCLVVVERLPSPRARLPRTLHDTLDVSAYRRFHPLRDAGGREDGYLSA